MDCPPSNPPLRRRSSSPAEGARPPGKPARRRSPAPTQDPPSVWTEAKVQAVLQGLKSFLGNAATKHGVPIEEVVALVRDELNDPGD